MTVLSVFFFLIIVSASADEAEPAILVKGPIRHQGIEFIGTNAISSYYGEYEYKDHTIRIYFTDENIILSDVWKASECRISGLLVGTGDENRINMVYQDKKGWTAFFSFDAESEYVCAFVGSYRTRQNYFINIARDKTFFSFPAILDLEQK